MRRERAIFHKQQNKIDFIHGSLPSCLWFGGESGQLQFFSELFQRMLQLINDHRGKSKMWSHNKFRDKLHSEAQCNLSLYLCTYLSIPSYHHDVILRSVCLKWTFGHFQIWRWSIWLHWNCKHPGVSEMAVWAGILIDSIRSVLQMPAETIAVWRYCTHSSTLTTLLRSLTWVGGNEETWERCQSYRNYWRRLER